MEQQTAVEWLFMKLDNILELYPSEWEKVSNAVEQAKAMEKEQIEMAIYEALVAYGIIEQKVIKH